MTEAELFAAYGSGDLRFTDPPRPRPGRLYVDPLVVERPQIVDNFVENFEPPGVRVRVATGRMASVAKPPPRPVAPR